MSKLAVLTPNCMTLRTTLLPSVLMHPGIAVLFVLFEWKIRLGRFVNVLRQIRGFWSYLICFVTLKVNNLVVLMAPLAPLAERTQQYELLLLNFLNLLLLPLLLYLVLLAYHLPPLYQLRWTSIGRMSRNSCRNNTKRTAIPGCINTMGSTVVRKVMQLGMRMASFDIIRRQTRKVGMKFLQNQINGTQTSFSTNFGGILSFILSFLFHERLHCSYI